MSAFTNVFERVLHKLLHSLDPVEFRKKLQRQFRGPAQLERASIETSAVHSAGSGSTEYQSAAVEMAKIEFIAVQVNRVVGEGFLLEAHDRLPR